MSERKNEEFNGSPNRTTLNSSNSKWRHARFQAYAGSGSAVDLALAWLGEKNREFRMDLADKRIVILGGTSGIGLAVARMAANEGAVVVVASSSKDKVSRTKSLLPPSAEGGTVDLTSEQSIKEFFDKIGEFDHLVYTAGEPLLSEPLETLSLERAQKFFGIRFWGSFLAAKYGAPHIRGGSIVFSSGMASRRSRTGWSVISSVCGASESLTRALAVELAPLRVNLVCPGLVRTELWDVMPAAARDAMYQRAQQNLLVGRPGEPDDLAKAYLYLMKTGFSTGQIIVVDGGASVG
jgi:NAD(P)-dependent dehydrogenase (short-subunit alcohol dehydrogenase family)